MQWSLIAVVHIVNALFGASCASAETSKEQLARAYEEFGFSPHACVPSAFFSCESSSTTEPSISVVDSIEFTNLLRRDFLEPVESVAKPLLQEREQETENSESVTMYKSMYKSLVQEINSEFLIHLVNISHRLSNLIEIQKEMKSEVLVLQQEANHERTRLSNSISEIKIFLQEVKRELENTTNNFPSRDCAIPGGTTATPDGMELGKKLPKNCAELKVLGENLSGVQTLCLDGTFIPRKAVVYCDQATDGGGWTVIQSRSPLPVRENFSRSWNEYVEGFGDPKGEYWLGLDNIHALTNSTQMELRVDLEDADGRRRWALYRTFHVGDAASKYVLTIGNYSGDARDGLAHPIFKDFNLNGMMFTTYDYDNDLYWGNCAEDHKGGWWFNRCFGANLNGLPIVGETSYEEGIIWDTFRSKLSSMKMADMKIRPVTLGF